MHRWVFCAVALLAFSEVRAWWSGDGEPPFGKLSDGLATDHIDFAAKQSAPLTVFVTAFGVGQREVAELRQRFAFTPVFFPVASRDSANPWETSRRTGTPVKIYLPSMDEAGYREKADALLARLPECDAVLIGKTDPAVFPADDRAKIFDRVRAGAGLVFIALADAKVEMEGVDLAEVASDAFFPVSLVPNLRGLKLYEGRLGKGKVLEVVYANPPFEISPQRAFRNGWLEPLTPYESEDPLYYDFCHAFLGQCLWRVTAKPAGMAAKTSVAVYDFAGERIAVSSFPKGLPNSARLAVEQTLDAAGGTLDYAVLPAVGDASASIVSFAFARDAWKPGETVTGSLSINGTGDVRVSLTDEYQREIWRGEFPDCSGERTLAIAFPHAKSRFALAKATLRTGGRLADEAHAKLYFNTVAQDRDDFCFSMWSDHASKSRVSKIGLEQLRRSGVDNVMECFLTYGGVTPERRADVPRRIHEAGLNYSIYISYLRGPGQADAHGENCRIFDAWDDYVKTGSIREAGGRKTVKLPDGTEKAYRRLKTFVQDSAAGAKDLGVYFYNLGDENDLAHHGSADLENCFCNACQARFRTYLKNVHGSLEALNAEYRSKYASWDDVKAMPFVESAKQRRIPLWVDFRAFMEEQFVNLHRLSKAEIEEVDPGAVMGSEGYVYPANSFTGYCFYKLLPHFTFGAPYFNDRDVHALKYLAPGATRAAWYGTYESENTPAVTRRTPWQYLFAGLDGAFWWYAAFTPTSGTFSNCGIFRPDMTFLEHYAASAEEMAFIRASGLGKLLHGAQATPASVAVHYSNPCLHASTVNPGMTTWELSHQDFATAFGECSVPYAFLSPPEIAGAGGVPARFKILALPYSQALSSAECAAMRAFAERGGIILADELPGMMNEHGRVLPENPVQDLFGAALQFKRTGKGGAVLLGDYLRGIDNRVATGSAGGLAAGLLRYLALAGVQPAARVTDELGSLRHADIWRKGDFTLVCMMGPAEALGGMARAGGAESGTKRTAALGDSARRRIVLPRPAWAYDLGAGGKLLGHGTAFEVTLKQTVGRVIAFTEKQLKCPELSLSVKSAKPGETVECAISEVNGCALVSVTGPDGREIFADRVTASPASFAPAWNEPKGRYRVRITSAVGGFTADKEFTVE